MNISQLFGSGSIPVGGLVLMLDAPNPVVQQGAEYLRTGTIKAYDSSYAAAIASAPQLRVFGSDAKTYGVATGAERRTVHYIGTNYISMIYGGSASQQYGATLNNMSAAVVIGVPTNLKRVATIGSSYLVAPSNSSNTAPNYTSNGSTFAAVGGSFGAFPVASAIASDNVSKWITLSSLTATAGEQGYIAAANPSGSWTVSASTNLGMTSVQAVAMASSGVVVAAGTSASATTGKLASCPALGGTWVDRTAATGLAFAVSGNVEDVVWDGTNFVALAYKSANNPLAIITSPDGVTWTNQGLPFDISSLYPLSGASSWAYSLDTANAIASLCTDGVGTVVLTMAASATVRPVFFVSTDHGVTWAAAQIYIGKATLAATTRTMSLANGRWVYNHSGNYQAIVDIGSSLVTPDFIGQQLSLAAGQFVRIK